jgi:hypothetical protein
MMEERRKERKNSKTFQAEGATQRFAFTLAAFLALQPYSFFHLLSCEAPLLLIEESWPNLT